MTTNNHVGRKCSELNCERIRELDLCRCWFGNYSSIEVLKGTALLCYLQLLSKHDLTLIRLIELIIRSGSELFDPKCLKVPNLYKLCKPLLDC